jgi:hypothetical protein
MSIYCHEAPYSSCDLSPHFEKTHLLPADFLTGVYHWSVDNYGDGSTPIVGSQIAAFQGHHQKPWTITEREFCNNVHKVKADPGSVAIVGVLGSQEGGALPSMNDPILQLGK